jgi:cytoskeletal protein RodZ
MESLGEKLKSAREERGYSIEQVARDTNIARRFIIALEEENFDQFPGDTYLLGFLRNYSEYLGLDAERMSTLYKNMQLQEQPAPMDELIHRRKGPSRGLLITALLVLVVLAGGGAAYYLLSGDGGPETASPREETEQEESPADRSVSYEMTEEILERRFNEGEVIGVRINGRQMSVELAAVDEELELAFAGRSVRFSLGEERPIDLDGDGTDDIRLGVYDIDPQGNTAVLRLDRSLIAGSEPEEGEAVLEEQPSALGSTTEEAREEEPVTVLTADEPEPFTISAVMRGYCMVRYQKDGELRDQRYFDRDETFRLDVSRRAIIWVSNAGAFNAKIGGREVSLGDAGEVSVKLFSWEEDEESGNYRLVMIPVY